MLIKFLNGSDKQINISKLILTKIQLFKIIRFNI